MCGRYAVDPRKLERLVRLLSLPEPKFTAHFDIHPSQTVPVIRDAGNGPEWAMMRWGLVPHWAKEAKTAYSTFNARVETAAQKPAFREPWKHRRCIIPATGFYEWQALESGKKQPWYFDSGDGQALALAGLWDHWTDGIAALDSCTILVGSPDPAVTGIHDRSPVMLGDTALRLWISPALKPEDVSRVLALPHDTLKVQPVSRVAEDGLHPLTA
ncbi:SOS response-associated peptidase [Acidithiobacillus sp.]|jgi:putative SOS response-associated peptidase YedK|uniref:SOS response-associated peptidase n=1 Tax=Acidithiobacillus sp. TaxID=1872118 RepID=UPI0025C12701|nr:SOS response-associated peptidase [Acidithiobacillus sp.]MCK9187840.1 SOS response-associated peptidase [Acidithiobacillus sp.]MCK9358730.1 SOS response-associated peptidase [Acidithiobacillus sp.]